LTMLWFQYVQSKSSRLAKTFSEYEQCSNSVCEVQTSMFSNNQNIKLYLQNCFKGLKDE
jgi:hypothetical protein